MTPQDMLTAAGWILPMAASFIIGYMIAMTRQPRQMRIVLPEEWEQCEMDSNKGQDGRVTITVNYRRAE